MNINFFFFLISLSLMMILFLFKPLDIKQKIFNEVSLFSISSFTMHELNSDGLLTLMNGEKATKYTDRYVVEKMDYTDNSKKYIANMKSNSGVYKDDIVSLSGDIVYIREDGLTFQTQKAIYNKKTNIAMTEADYLLFRDNNRVTGKELKYNNSLDTIESKDVTAIYQLQESKR